MSFKSLSWSHLLLCFLMLIWFWHTETSDCHPDHHWLQHRDWTRIGDLWNFDGTKKSNFSCVSCPASTSDSLNNRIHLGPLKWMVWKYQNMIRMRTKGWLMSISNMNQFWFNSWISKGLQWNGCKEIHMQASYDVQFRYVSVWYK